MGPGGFFSFSKIKSVQVFNQDSQLSPNIVIKKYCVRLQSITLALSLTLYDMDNSSIRYSYWASNEKSSNNGSAYGLGPPIS